MLNKLFYVICIIFFFNSYNSIANESKYTNQIYDLGGLLDKILFQTYEVKKQLFEGADNIETLLNTTIDELINDANYVCANTVYKVLRIETHDECLIAKLLENIKKPITEKDLRSEPNKLLANYYIEKIDNDTEFLEDLINSSKEHLADKKIKKECPNKPGNTVELCAKVRQEIKDSIIEDQESIKTQAKRNLIEYRLNRFNDEINQYLWQISLVESNFSTTILLQSLKNLNYYNFLNDNLFDNPKNPIRTYITKRMINAIQKQKSQLHLISNQQAKNFLNTNKLVLKEAVQDFNDYNLGDDAFFVMNIIKENDYINFNTRALKKKNYKPISFTKNEKQFHENMLTLESELEQLKDNFYKETNEDKIQIIKKQIQKKYLTATKHYYNFINNHKKVINQDATFIRDKDEAYLYISHNQSTNNISNIKKETLNINFYLNNISKGYKFDITRSELIEQINDLALKVQSNSKNYVKNIEQLSPYFSDIKEDLKNNEPKKIKVIFADTFLLNMPLDLLLNEKDNEYVLEYMNYSEGYLEKPGLKNNLVLFGASQGGDSFKKLPGVKKELELISQISPTKRIQNKTIYLDNDFTYKNFINSYNESSKYIHISSHYDFNYASIESARLLLGSGEIISLEEIDNNLKKSYKDLVVLSACKTGGMVDTNDDNIYEGLAAVFQNKGAKNVLATLWEVEDQATSLFMFAFYSLLSENNIEPSHALALTKSIFRAGGYDHIDKQINVSQLKESLPTSKIKKYKHPFYWSAFQIYTSI
jgi:CHAT domain-containing protein